RGFSPETFRLILKINAFSPPNLFFPKNFRRTIFRIFWGKIAYISREGFGCSQRAIAYSIWSGGLSMTQLPPLDAPYCPCGAYMTRIGEMKKIFLKGGHVLCHICRRWQTHFQLGKTGEKVCIGQKERISLIKQKDALL
ncbi:MAG: hypothetical protein ACLFUS_04900, partial [Candidatus Sumerlaeia bacterium]